MKTVEDSKGDKEDGMSGKRVEKKNCYKHT